jgi:phospholipase/carboxylesterase
VTINGGFVMPAWYDIRSLDLRDRADEAGVRASAARVTALLARERSRGIPSERIVLAGFSQGGAIALHTALRHPERLAGAIALSTYLVCADSLAAERSEANRDLPIFQGHGTADPMVPLARGRECRDALAALGHPVEWHTYAMPHSVSPEEIEDVGTWLRARLAA